MAAAPLYIRWARHRYRRHAQPLTPDEVRLYAPYFPAELLAMVRVARVDCIVLPLSGAGRTIARAFQWILRPIARYINWDVPIAGGLRGIALWDTVVLEKSTQTPGILFHELVHIAQFRIFGYRRFLRAYLKSWAATGGNYHAITLERQAYDLQANFENPTHAPFRVVQAIRPGAAPSI